MARERVVGSVREGSTVTNRIDCIVSWSFFMHVDGVITGSFLIHKAPDYELSPESIGCYAVAHTYTHMHLPYLFGEEEDALAFAEELESAMGDKAMVLEAAEFQKNLYGVPELLAMAERHNVTVFLSLPIEMAVNEIALGSSLGDPNNV